MAAAATPDAAAGWAAHLRLRFTTEPHGGRTRLTERRHVGPLLVQKPFYPEGDPCHVYLIHPPGGVVGADQLQLDVQVDEHAHALLTTPAAGKFYRCGGGPPARLRQAFEVAGRLEWLPQENIFYPGCRLELHTVVRLQAAARAICWEIGCLGLPAAARPFDAGSLRQSLELWQEDRPLLLERLRLDPDCLEPHWGLGGQVAFGTWLAYPAGEPLLQLARAQLAGPQLARPQPDGPQPDSPQPRCAPADRHCAGLTLACTLLDGVLCIRGRAARTDLLRGAFTALWRALRPALLGREAVAPRIWST